MSASRLRLLCAVRVRAAIAVGGLAQPDPKDDGPRTGVYWRNRPSIQLGEHVRLDLRLKLQFDERRFDPEIDEDEFDFRVRRWGINGEIGDHVEFQIERDFQRSAVGATSSSTGAPSASSRSRPAGSRCRSAARS